MKSPEDILRAEAEGRARAARQQKVLDQLENRTRRRIASGVLQLVLAAGFSWIVLEGYLSDEAITKREALFLVSMLVIAAQSVRLGFMDLFKDPRDLALRDLLRESVAARRGDPLR